MAEFCSGLQEEVNTALLSEKELYYTIASKSTAVKRLRQQAVEKVRQWREPELFYAAQAMVWAEFPRPSSLAVLL